MGVSPDLRAAPLQLGQEHDALHDATRALAEKETLPHAADIDERERYPAEAGEALVRSAFHAIHIPEQYEGEGADLVAAVDPHRGSSARLRVILADPSGQQPVFASRFG